MNSLSNVSLKEKVNLNPISRRNRPKIKIEFQKGDFLVKTADQPDELAQAYQLRYEIFYNEFCGRSNALGIDHDRFDKNADILVIIDMKTRKVIGTYRIICSEFSKRFYSASEFHIRNFLNEEGAKVELSRACIHSNYRNGSAIRLLWRGVYQYLKAVDARYLFGCSSVSGLSPLNILALMNYLQNHNLTLNHWQIFPRPNFDNSAELLKDLRDFIKTNPIDEMPALFRAYLNMGAKFEVVPAYDEHFLCYDFFTVLDVQAMDSAHSRKFGKQ